MPLSSADFAMSKIATYGDRGRNLRKLIDYFCHLAVAPTSTPTSRRMTLSSRRRRTCSPSPGFRTTPRTCTTPPTATHPRRRAVGFDRGKASSIVSELSGRDPETRKVDEERIPVAYDKLERALLQIVRKYHFENFLMIIKSAGFIAPGMIGSKNALNFAYALYLRLRDDTELPEGERKRIVKRWFVMSMLTGRHSGSFESTWDRTSVGSASRVRRTT